ncbi:hypothetical protein OO013_16705 [Mangrovivirga sp. M17]|uniref:SPOR domain-containing protein n=1 Tax=Mangrovivirga halotolerans TaxID=2993936 RepID=A0ABT3RUR7_9BACT|nr:DUF6616 family protein [Mangrovivirga halotolerans]MCX2745523.1 hypothetical protein [Mangrovivirga halotolerans]
MKQLVLLFGILFFYSITAQAQENEKTEGGYILTEIWKAKPAWYELSPKERALFFEEKINPLLMSTLKNGAEILGTAINNNTGDERMDYQFMAVWKFPDKESSDKLEKAAKEAGFLIYFDQVNFSGNIIPPPMLNQSMIDLSKNNEHSSDTME